MLERFARWANSIRSLFERLAKRIDGVGIASILVTVTAALFYLSSHAAPENCRKLPIRIIDLELTFSARRYAALLNWLDDHGCKSAFLNSLVSTDLLFPLAYGAALCALFIWA